MKEDDFKDLEGQTIQDLLDKTNPDVFEWIREVLQLNVMRTVSLNTFLLNYYIFANYLPGLKFLFYKVPALMPENMNHEKMKFFLAGSERIFLLLLLFSMSYKGNDRVTSKLTDAKMDELYRAAPLINQFFFINAIEPEIYDLELPSLLKFSQGFRHIDTLIPNMDFDPEFQSILNCEALKQVYDLSHISDFYDLKGLKPAKYPAEKNLLIKSSRLDKNKFLFDIDSNLAISKFMTETSNDLGVYLLGSYKQIDEIIAVFTEYYTKKLPHKTQEIKGYLLCFGELLKIAQGRLYCRFRYNQVIKMLKKKIPQPLISKFFKQFCMIKRYHSFSPNFQDFNPKKVIKEYNRFLSYCMYHLSGIIFTGVFLIWRALIKYLELLQADNEFKRNIKGALLENWCYDKAIEAGFQPEKLILTNPENRQPEKYKKLKNQIKHFPKAPIEYDAIFPEDSAQYSYFENDLMFRVDNYLFMFECKATKSPIGEQQKFYTWIKNFNINISNLIKGANLVLYNLEKKSFNIDYLRGIHTIIPFQIQTEGILYDTMSLSTHGYLKLLKKIKRNTKSGKLPDFMQQLSRIERIERR